MIELHPCMAFRNVMWFIDFMSSLKGSLAQPLMSKSVSDSMYFLCSLYGGGVAKYNYILVYMDV